MKTILGLALGLAAAATAQGSPIYGFSGVTANNTNDVLAGEAQLSVELFDLGAGQVSFVFSNAGPAASSITDVYFDDDLLLALLSIQNGPGVSFSAGASPSNLPGGNAINFIGNTALGADSDAPAQPNGVNPGEMLGLTMQLLNNQTFADVLSDIGSGDLRIGIHVQGFDGGGSESFVNTPEPSTLLLALVGLVAKLRKRR
jgi:PEP-CTERM motif